jgi:signal transduction histidine kinase
VYDSESALPKTENGAKSVPDPAGLSVVNGPELTRRLTDTAQFAGRIAHDFNNILMGVMGFAELAQTQLKPGSQAASYLAELLAVAQRGLDTTRQMQQYGRSGLIAAQPSRLDQVWQDFGRDGWGDPTAIARVRAELAPELPLVRMAADPLRVVLRAILQNALEATPASDKVAVSARAVHFDEPVTAALPAELQPGPYVELAVADSGTGFRAEVLQKLRVEPLVTTKVRHRGLGLATAFRTLHAHGGGLCIQSTPRGATVRTYLPASAGDEPAPERPAPPSPS